MVRNSLHLPALTLLSVALVIAGCSGGGGSTGTTTTPPPTSPATQHGTVMGGTIPVIGATVQLYAVGTSGDGSAATPLLNPAVTSDSTGSFTMQGSEACPSASAFVYLVATGGNPGLASGTNNKALSMMAAIGPCSNLTPSASFVINELTTVAAVFALEPYFTSPTAVGASPANAAALTSAFTLAAAFANPATGVTPGASVPTGDTVPTEQINTLANILATCIDTTGGVAGDSTPCGDLLTLATPSGATAPVNTLTALLNIAKNPTLNVAALFRLASDSGPFQPIPAQAPLDWTVRLQLPSTLKITPVTGLGFAATPVSNTAPTQAITLTNTGTSAITLSGLSLAGANASDFAQTSNCAAALQPQVSCTAAVNFTPTATGSRMAYLVITSNAPNSPQPILLTGTAVAATPAISLSPTSLDFAAQIVGTTSTPQTVTLTNSGNAPLSLTGISLTGANAADYTLANACATTLAAAAHCTITVTFNPTAAGTRSAAFVLTNNSSTPSISVPLMGTAVAATPAITLSPTSLNFASEMVGTASTPQTVTLINSGNAPLSLTGISLTGANAADYTLANACATTLAAADHCAITITFNPTATGTRTAAISIASNAATSPSPLPITGTGVSGPISPPSTSVRVYAGRTPVSGANVQIYTVGTTADASAATPLLFPPLVTDTTGSAVLGGYTCPSAQALVYLIATGGNPGISASNPDLAMMTAIGPCGSITSAPLVVNELTTVAAVNALVSYMASATAVGSGPADIAALGNAFTLAAQFVDPATGTAPGTGVPSGYTVPVATINTLGDILNACTASTGGTAGDGSACGTLFALATPPGKAIPTDSLEASLAIAGTPAFNTYLLYSLTNTTQPFQPNLTSLPGDFGVRLLPAGLTASTASINFGSAPFPLNPIPLNSQTIVLTNNTSAPVAIGTPAITGDTTHFGVTVGSLTFFSGQSNVCYLAIPAGGSCALVVSFIPDSSASFAATLTVPNSSSTPSISIALAGQGIPATATGLLASPTLLNFSSAGTPKSVTLTNSGSTTITLDNISLVELSTDIFGNVSPLTPRPLSSSPFSQNNNCGASLAPAASCVVSIGTVSNPALSGNILNNQPLPDIAYLSLVVNHGTVVQPVKVQYDPSQALNFGGWSVGIESNPLLMSGEAPQVSGETFIGFTATITGPNASDFSFSPTSIVSETSCTGPQAGTCDTQANIYFTATATGPRSATVSYSSGASSPGLGSITTSGSYSLSGVGLSSGPHFILEAPLRDSWIPLTNTSPYFLDTDLDKSSQPVSLIVANSGTEPLSFGTPTITGPNASDFSVNSTCSTLAVGSSTQTAPTCTLTLTATPTATGGRSAQLILKDITSGTQQTIPLYVYSSYPTPHSSVYGLYFPSTMAGTTSAPQTFTITYYQGDSITLTMNASSPSAAFQIPSGFTCTSSPCTVPVTFSPSAVNTSYFGTLSITDKLSGTTGTTFITLSGHSPPPPPLLSFSPASLTFSSLVGTASAPQTVTVTNIATGGQTVDLTSISLSGSASGYSLTNNCPTALAPTATCTFSVTFNAPAVGTYNAGVTIVSNSPSSPDTVPLTGTGSISQVPPTVTPFLLRFPPAPLTEVRPTQTFTITNSALHPLKIVASNGCGEACADFALSSYTCSTETCIITVSYAPKTATGLSDSASFDITDSLNGRGTNILFYGYPGLANLTFTPTTLSFPSQTVGTKSTTASFIVSNIGDGYGVISAGTLSGPDFVYSGPSQVQIAPNSTQTLPYAFVPIAAGDRSATVQITNIFATPTILLTTLTLTGTGIAP